MQPSQRRQPALSQSCEFPEKALTPFREPSASPSRLWLFLQQSSGQTDLEELGDKPRDRDKPDQGHPDMVMSFLTLEVLVELSERSEMVSRVVLGQPCRQPGPGAECKAWPGLGIRMWSGYSKNPPC